MVPFNSWQNYWSRARRNTNARILENALAWNFCLDKNQIQSPRLVTKRSKTKKCYIISECICAICDQTRQDWLVRHKLSHIGASLVGRTSSDPYWKYIQIKSVAVACRCWSRQCQKCPSQPNMMDICKRTSFLSISHSKECLVRHGICHKWH